MGYCSFDVFEFEEASTYDHVKKTLTRGKNAFQELQRGAIIAELFKHAIDDYRGRDMLQTKSRHFSST